MAQGAADADSGADIDWAQLRVGSLTGCCVSEHADYGTVVDLDVHEVCVGEWECMGGADVQLAHRWGWGAGVLQLLLQCMHVLCAG